MGSRGGISIFDGWKFSSEIKLRADVIDRTHEVWGGCGYKTTPDQGPHRVQWREISEFSFSKIKILAKEIFMEAINLKIWNLKLLALT